MITLPPRVLDHKPVPARSTSARFADVASAPHGGGDGAVASQGSPWGRLGRSHQKLRYEMIYDRVQESLIDIKQVPRQAIQLRGNVSSRLDVPVRIARIKPRRCQSMPWSLEGKTGTESMTQYALPGLVSQSSMAWNREETP